MKTKLQIRSIFGAVLFEYETENNTIVKTLQEAIKKSANLCGANLYGSDLYGSDLYGANLCGSDLYGSDLSGANLRGANLSGANLDKRYIQVSCIGSAKRMTIYCFDDDIVWCGCFKGTLDEFENRVKVTHKDNPQYLKEYTGFIAYIKSLQ